MLLPHVSADEQVAEQPSPSARLPSSHVSSGVTMESPHTAVAHTPSRQNALGWLVHASLSTLPMHASTSACDAQRFAMQTASLGQSRSPHGTSEFCKQPASHTATTSRPRRIRRFYASAVAEELLLQLRRCVLGGRGQLIAGDARIREICIGDALLLEPGQDAERQREQRADAAEHL